MKEIYGSGGVQASVAISKMQERIDRLERIVFVLHGLETGSFDPAWNEQMMKDFLKEEIPNPPRRPTSP